MKKIDDIDKYLQETSDTQGAREQDYLTSGVFTKKTDAGDLHMFFSPNMVPAGLTDDEVRLCLQMYDRTKRVEKALISKKKDEIRVQLEEKLKDDYLLFEKLRNIFMCTSSEYDFEREVKDISFFYSEIQMAMHHPFSLPYELRKSPMTRESFTLGIEKLIDNLDELEKSLSD